MVRLFIALPTPADVQQAMADVIARLRTTQSDVRWETAGKLHATLRFLGDTDERLVPRIRESLEVIAGTTPPCTVTYRSLGCFPDTRNPRVIWIGMEDPGGTLRRLNAEIEQSARAIGFKPDDREFHPHVTLGRVKSRHNVTSLLATMESLTFHSNPVTVRDIHLIRSELKPTGSVYTIVASPTFTGKEGP
jgi:2'-5' RNA ligase